MGLLRATAGTLIAFEKDSLLSGFMMLALLPPIGLAATIEYYRHGNVNLPAAILIAASLLVGACRRLGWV